MQYKNFVGIDVSKATLDAYIHGCKRHKKFSNITRGYDALCAWITETLRIRNLSEVLVCFEHTGLYSLPLALYLEKAAIPFSMISALQIKRSLGLVRGKNDQLDAKRIAAYGYLYRETLPVTKLPSRELMQLQPLLTLRDRLVRNRAGYLATRYEQARFLMHSPVPDLSPVYDQIINELTVQINSVEQTIKIILNSSPELKLTFDLITGIKGVGKITALYLIVYTHNFTRFSTWRKFACYAGVAPFEHQSGSSIRGKTQVSTLAHRQMKKVLHMAALSASQFEPELHVYFVKRIEAGKSKMATLNAIRNKVLARIFAVALRKSPYVNLNRFAA